MRRREFIGALGAVAASGLLPIRARAQEAGRTYRIGGLHQSPRNAPHHVGFFAELRRQGFIDGQNLTVVGAYGQRSDQFAELAREQIKARVDAMVCGGEAAARAALRGDNDHPDHRTGRRHRFGEAWCVHWPSLLAIQRASAS